MCNLRSHFIASLMFYINDPGKHYSGFTDSFNDQIKCNILVQNIITAFNCQDEIPLDDKYENHHTLNPNGVLKSQADENFIFISSLEYVGHQGS